MFEVIILNTLIGTAFTSFVLAFVGTETNVDISYLWIGKWMRHIRHCPVSQSLSESTKVKLGGIAFLLWVLMLLAIGSLWFLVLPYVIYRGVLSAIKNAVGVDS